MKNAVWMLRENIQALLTAQNKKQKDLAFYCDGKDKSWINKFLNGTREIQFRDLDRIAQFFHLATYQLFLPGIARETERRSGKDRRSGVERRVSEDLQSMIQLRPYLEKAQRGLSHAPTSVNKEDQPTRLTAITNQLQRLSAEAAALISSETDTRGQTATTRRELPKVPARRRSRRRSDVEGTTE